MSWTGWTVLGSCALVLTCASSGRAQPDLPGGLEMSLETAQRIALEENPSLQTAGARIRQAEARLAQVNASFFPTLGVGAGARETRFSDRSVREAEDALTPLDDDFGQRVQQAVDDSVARFARANQKASAAARADLASQLSRFPALVPAEQALMEETDRLRKVYANTLQSELSAFNPVGSMIDALGIDTDPQVDDSRTSYQARAYVSWLLFDGFSRHFSRRVARYGREESTQSRRDAQRLLLGAVARAYYQAQLAREEMTIGEADVEFNARLLDEAQRRREVGQTSLSTELNFEIRRNIAETSMVNAARQYAVSLVALAALLGQPGAEWPAGVALAPLQDERPEEMRPPEPDASIEYAMLNRPDVEFARLAREQSKSSVRLARSAYSPSVNLTGSYGGNRVDDPDFDQDDLGGTAGVILTWDLFQGGLRRARVREAAALEDEADSLFTQARLAAASEVRAAVVTLRFAGELLTLQRRNLSIVEQTRDLVELEYKAGHASLVRLNEAQRDLVLARSRYATVLASLHVAWHEYLQSTAESLERVHTAAASAPPK